ncbi:hypothetical protein [Thermostilla marina]
MPGIPTTTRKSRDGASFCRWAAAALAGLALAIGCRPPEPEEPPPKPLVETLGELPGIRHSPDLRLREELARIIEEQGTPEQLMPELPPPEENVAAVFDDLFPKFRIPAIWAQTEELLPGSDFRFPTGSADEAHRLIARYADQRKAVREALDRPQCVFPIRYTAGYGDELVFLDAASIAARLELFAAVEALAADQPGEAFDDLSVVLQIAAYLSQPPHPITRVRSAILRAEALSGMQALFAHPKTDPALAERLYRRLLADVRNWPSDAAAWIGERALGLHAFEVVRQGRLFDLLTEAEVRHFAELGTLEDVPRLAMERADMDEWFYLQAMRKVIDSAELPYARRNEVIRSIEESLNAKRDTPEYPLVSGFLLLPPLREEVRLQCRDRALCEGWLLALERALGHADGAQRTNPMTGQPFLLERPPGWISVQLIDPDHEAVLKIEVPDYAGQK